MKRPGANKKLILGVTGSLGSGKTTVARIFKKLGAKVVDADRIAHRLMCPQDKVYRRILHCFGKGILKSDRTIDRHKLASFVFARKKSLRALDQMTHPEIIRMIKKEIRSSPKRLIILDAPLLLEAGLDKAVDKIIVVTAKRSQQIKRLQEKGTFSRTDILKRLRQQLPLKNKVRMADFVIDNTGTIRETEKQIKKIIRRMGWRN